MYKKILFRYFIFVGVPYFIARCIEKYFWKNASPKFKKELNKKLKDLLELDTVLEHTKNGLYIRIGANPVVLWFAKVVISDLAIKVAIVRTVGAYI